jgi:hypothetical protein
MRKIKQSKPPKLNKTLTENIIVLDPNYSGPKGKRKYNSFIKKKKRGKISIPPIHN